ncbi:MAG TPA: four-helix bundle copper-binding protein [Kineosporiaceae bacterium]|nr:four-helix bundle copper-binding protein [Kineosporiaceae bacterium]
MTVAEMIESHPDRALDAAALVACIEAAHACAAACTACADACLAEDDVASMRTCIRRDLDCADIATTTASVLSRQVAMDLGLVRVVLEACAVAAKRCAVECELHADAHDHCRACAQACTQLYSTSRALLESLRDHDVPQPDER